jgi:hypothetical protein
MSRLEDYIRQVGTRTTNAMKFVLHDLLSKRYAEFADPLFAGKLAAEYQTICSMAHT